MPFTIPLPGKSRKAPACQWLLAACVGVFLFAHRPSFAQAPSPVPTPGEENWQLIEQVQGVSFYYQVSQCNGHSFLLFKAANGNATTVRGSWEIKVQHGERKRMCVGVLRPTPAGQAQASSCERPSPDMAVPFADLDPAALQVSVTARIIINFFPLHETIITHTVARISAGDVARGLPDHIPVFSKLRISGGYPGPFPGRALGLNQ